VNTEKEKDHILKELQEKDELLSYQKQETDSLNEQLTLLVKSHEHIEGEKQKLEGLKELAAADLERLVKKLEFDGVKNIKGDLIGILNLLTSEISRPSQRGYDDSDIHTISSVGNNRSNSYITQNYEKFKQQGKGNTDFTGNDSKRGSTQYKESPVKHRESPSKKGLTPSRDSFAKKYNDNINYLPVKNNDNVLQHRGSISGYGSNPQPELIKHNIIPRIKDNNYINKFINK
jgi:hypothetical protein